ncbi:nucleotide-diphospho-sugar transferase-domain-containing protein [Haematococcus lacustris]
MTAAEDRGGQHHGHSHSQHSTARGPSRGLFFGMLAFVGIAVYVLIVTHHLKIDMHGLHLQSHGRSSGGTSGPAELMKRAAVDPAAAAHFTKRMISIGAYSRYDADKNGQLSQAEFEVFLNDLAKSNILDPMALNSDHGTAADLVIRQQTVSAVNAATGTGGKQNKQAAKTDGVVVSEPQTTAQACPELSKELVASFAKDNTIILTVSDWRIFQNFGVNWMKHLKRLGVENYLVGATDKKTAAFLGSQGRHPCFKFFEEGPDHSDKEYKYGSEHYVAATWRKVTVVQQIVGWGFNVLHSDVDVVWFRDPLPYMLGPALKDVDMAVSTDLVSTGNSKRDEGLEVSVHQHVNVNTGVYFVKSTPGGQAFMLAWAGLRKTLIHDNDQTGLYQWIRGQPAEVDGQKRFVQLHAGETPFRLGLLSVSMLLNGYSYFIPKLNVYQNVSALGIHLTWVPLSREGKFHRMRDGMLYNDEPEYYSGPQFITADIDFPPVPPGYNEMRDTEAMIKIHLAKMEVQLKQMYRAMAIAVIMNRTLVLPKLQCFCYKNWFMMEQCRIPGDRATVYPMECQLDQWLRPKVIYNYGPNIVGKDGPQTFMFREHTMFENPNFPKKDLESEVVVEPANVPTAKVDTSSPKTKVLVPQEGLKQTALKALLEGLGPTAKIIRIRHPSQVFAGWDDDKLKTSFEAFLDKVAGNWCCRDKPFIAKGLKEKEKLAISW